MVSRFRRRSAALLISILLGACQAASGLSPLSSGQHSAMAPDNTGLRNSISVVAAPFPNTLAYTPVRACMFVQAASASGYQATLTHPTISMKRVRDRLLMTAKDEKGTGTALFGTDGTLFDYNYSDVLTESRISPESFGAEARRRADEAAKAGSKGADFLNPVGALFPRYHPGPYAPGQTVGAIYGSRGDVWASLVYRGMASYNGKRGILVDFTRILASRPSLGPVTVGFDVIDPQNGLPILWLLDAGSKVRLERLSCV